MVQVYTQNTNGKVILLCGDRKSFRCRQRAIDSKGLKVKPMKFMSLKQAHKKGNTIIFTLFRRFNCKCFI